MEVFCVFGMLSVSDTCFEIAYLSFVKFCILFLLLAAVADNRFSKADFPSWIIAFSPDGRLKSRGELWATTALGSSASLIANAADGAATLRGEPRLLEITRRVLILYLAFFLGSD